MSSPTSPFDARKALLIERLRVQRMELVLHADAARQSLRPAGLIAAVITKPGALFAAFQVVAPMLGLRRFARWARLASAVFAVWRMVPTPRTGKH